MSKRNKVYFCQECQEMTFHPTQEHDESMTSDYYERRLKTDDESESFGEGFSFVSLVV